MNESFKDCLKLLSSTVFTAIYLYLASAVLPGNSSALALIIPALVAGTATAILLGTAIRTLAGNLRAKPAKTNKGTMHLDTSPVYVRN